MRNVSKKSWQTVIQMCFLLLLLIQVTSGFSVRPKVCMTCPTPVVNITHQTSSSISFSWNSVTGASYYKVYYQRKEDNYTSSEFSTGDTSMDFSSLPSGTYSFFFTTDCGSEISQFVVFDDLIMG
jgi:hypothetical protein